MYFEFPSAGFFGLAQGTYFEIIMKGLLSIWSCIFFYELRIYFRHSFAWLYPLGFFVIVLSLFPLALTPDPRLLQALAPGAVWIAALLASLLSLEHIFLSEIEENHLEQLVLSRYPLAWLLIAKAAAHWLASQLPLILLVPVMGALFHFTINTLLVLMISLILGTPILTLIGMLGVALTRELR